MRRLILAAVLALAAHGLLLMSKGPWMAPRTTPPKWSMRPVVMELNAIAMPPREAGRVRSSQTQKIVSQVKAPRPSLPKEPPKERPKRKRPIKPKVKKPKKVKRAKKVRVCAVKKPVPRRPQPQEEEKIRTIEIPKEPDIKPQDVSKEGSSGTVSNATTPTDNNTWDDISDDILADAPQTHLASFSQGTAQEEAIVEAKPSYRKNTPPPYPMIARKRGYQGTVILEVLVTSEGKVGDIRVFRSSGHRILDRAAVKAVRNWIFEPGRRGEVPIDMWVKVPIRFVLK